MKFLSEGFTMALGKQSLTLQENAPKILFGTGIIGMIGSTVMACRATLKVEAILDKGQHDLATTKAMNHEDYSENDRSKDIAIIYTRTAAGMAKIYAPAVLLGVGAIGCLTKSHNMLVQRNAALTVAYTIVDSAFREYRGRVVERYGEDVDRELRYGSEKVSIKDEETGKKKTVTRVGPGEPSMYARFFDKTSMSWGKDPEVNFIFLRAQQSYFNHLLIARGHVFLNEVYDELGFPHSQAGAIVGWRMTEDREGDNFIDFGLFNDDQTVRDFVNGRNDSILLDFNVDGVIFDKIDTPITPLSWQRG
jgi:Family of unknown function (DUF6353)